MIREIKQFHYYLKTSNFKKREKQSLSLLKNSINRSVYEQALMSAASSEQLSRAAST